MALCCIGGVCIPYSAIVPLIVLGIKWILEKLVQMKLIPSTWVEKVNSILNGGISTTQKQSSSLPPPLKQESSCCSSSTGKSHDAQQGNNHSSFAVRGITSDDEWKEYVLQQSHSKSVIVKFTADWCHPCKAIHPVYCQLATATSNKSASFVTVDVDELDQVAGMYGIAILPTFAIFRNGQLVHKYVGSSEAKLMEFVDQCSDRITTQ